MISKLIITGICLSFFQSDGEFDSMGVSFSMALLLIKAGVDVDWLELL